MLTGRRAFDRPTAAETMTAVLKEDPTETTAAGIPPSLERVVRRCLEKDPANRFDSARDAAFALETITGSGGIPLPTDSRRRVRPAAAWPWGVVVAAVLIAAVATLRPVMMSEDVMPMRFSAVTNFAGLEAQPSLSPDGRSAAFVSNRDGQHDIWVGLVSGGNLIRITNDANVESQPRRSPVPIRAPRWDGSRLVYRPEFAEPRRLNIIAADGSGTVEALTCPRAYCEPTDWSSDGRSIIVNAYDGENVDVWSVGTTADVASQALLADPFAERDARVSPDRRWIAYVSDETGRPEVSIRSLVDRPRRYVISPGGGSQPVWHPSGRSLYYVDARGLLRKVAIQETNGALTFGQPTELKVPPIGSGHASTQYDVSADGRIYFLDQRAGASRPTEVRIIVGWSALLSKELLGR